MTSPERQQLNRWLTQLDPVIKMLENLAGSTEHQFLELGERFQDFALRSSRISTTANELTNLIAGDESSRLAVRLRHLFSNIENYLTSTRDKGSESCLILEQVKAELDQVVEPLQGFQKMDKALRMLSISTKIESARLGELGTGFTTLAVDVEKLSRNVGEKSVGIILQRHNLSKLITDNLDTVHEAEASKHEDANTILSGINASLGAISQLNESCSAAGSRAGIIAEEVAAEISNIVSSMQFHDITRQQIEHIIEALQKITHQPLQENASDQDCNTQIAKAGDICELQAAQLRHAAGQFRQATVAILENIHDIGRKQSQINMQLQETLIGSSNSAESSLLATMQQDMQRITGIMKHCAESDKKLFQAMAEVTGTIGEMSVFVSDIEAVGSEIDLIALNAQIKAAHTGTQGAALGVLAEAIKRLSLEAVVHTRQVSSILRAINSSTASLNSHDTADQEQTTNDQMAAMEKEAGQIISSMAHTNQILRSQLASLATMAEALSGDIDATTAGFHLHEESGGKIEQVLQTLEGIYREARKIVPASTEFIKNLSHMEKRYTMESERLIHEMLAASHGVSLSTKKEAKISTGSSEFGDNVDLF